MIRYTWSCAGNLCYINKDYRAIFVTFVAKFFLIVSVDSYLMIRMIFATFHVIVGWQEEHRNEYRQRQIIFISN